MGNDNHKQINVLLAEAKKIQEFIEKKSGDDPCDLNDRLSYINAYLARSGKMFADAKLLQDEAMKRVFAEYENLIADSPASIANKFIQSQCSEINYVVNWIERINRCLVHIGDNIRTQISFNKEEMCLTRKGY